VRALTRLQFADSFIACLFALGYATSGRERSTPRWRTPIVSWRSLSGRSGRSPLPCSERRVATCIGGGAHASARADPHGPRVADRGGRPQVSWNGQRWGLRREDVCARMRGAHAEIERWAARWQSLAAPPRPVLAVALLSRGVALGKSFRPAASRACRPKTTTHNQNHNQIHPAFDHRCTKPWNRTSEEGKDHGHSRPGGW